MTLNIERFCAVRPYLYHLTSRDNGDRIARERKLFPAADTIARSSAASLEGRRRSTHERVQIEGGRIELRDQQPLVAGHIDFQDGFSLTDLVNLINQHVFFWPGRESGPIRSGSNHFERYRHENPFVLRVPTLSLLKVNSECEPLFCRYNSGAPRCSGGKRSPRGMSTYLDSRSFLGTPSQVTEFVVRGAVVLPGDTEVSISPAGSWRWM